jgi:DNA-binding MarR family transcriptional regulator
VRPNLTDADYARLLEFRTGLRRFLHWSEAQAVEVGLTPAQHQLLLAVRGHPGRAGPTIGEIADTLLLRHHSAVELINRAEAAGLVRRQPDRSDQRVVRMALTALGSRRLRQLSERHLEELDRLRPQLSAMWHGIA